MNSEQTEEQKTGRRRSKIVKILLIIILFWFCFYAFRIDDLAYTHKLQKAAVADVYTPEGELTGKTEVIIDGTWSRFPGEEETFQGTFATDMIPKTMQTDKMKVTIRIFNSNPEPSSGLSVILVRHNTKYVNGLFENICYASRDLEQFAIMTADGKVISTDKELAELLLNYKQDNAQGVPEASWQ